LGVTFDGVDDSVRVEYDTKKEVLSSFPLNFCAISGVYLLV